MKNNKVRILFKPFTNILKRTKISGVASESVICAFATFLQLSSTRQLTLFNNLLETFSIKSSMANYTGTVKTVLYNDPTMEYLSHKYIFLLFVSIVPCILLVIIPSFLFFLYPTRVHPLISY